MKNEHTEQWGIALQQATTPQTQGTLARPVEDEAGRTVVANCCLGLGCEVAGLDRVAAVRHPVRQPGAIVLAMDDGEQEVYTYDKAMSLPPRSFIEWLGLDPGEAGQSGQSKHKPLAEFILRVDWPEALRTQCDEAQGWYHEDCGEDYCSQLLSGDEDTEHYAGLNDSLGLSFSQIGDIVRHFGVRL